jgi:hypothetical protein
MSKPYRCKKCLDAAERCKRCRKRRAAAVRTARELKRAEGQCTECRRKAQSGFVRCKFHRLENNRRSAEAHATERLNAE